MFSKILIKLVDQAIVPAILLLVTRVASVVLLASYFGVPLTIDNSGFVFNGKTEYTLINSYSILSMVAVTTVGLMYMLSKSYLFHDSHIAPNLTARLFSLRLSTFVQTSFELYSQGTVWLSYMYLMLLVSGAMVFFELIFAWVFFVTLILTIVSTVLLVFDLENEVDLRTEAFGDIEMDEVEDIVLKLEGKGILDE
jgi:hypothetical protein